MECHLSDYQTIQVDFDSHWKDGAVIWGDLRWPGWKEWSGFTVNDANSSGDSNCKGKHTWPSSRGHPYGAYVGQSKIKVGPNHYIHCRSGSYGQNHPQLIDGGTKHGHMKFICCPPGERKRYKNGEWGCP